MCALSRPAHDRDQRVGLPRADYGNASRAGRGQFGPGQASYLDIDPHRSGAGERDRDQIAGMRDRGMQTGSGHQRPAVLLPAVGAGSIDSYRSGGHAESTRGCHPQQYCSQREPIASRRLPVPSCALALAFAEEGQVTNSETV
jgi:hypothetical protein